MTIGYTGIHSRSADPFRPHDFDTKQTIINRSSSPMIFIAPKAYADILAIARLSGNAEIGWLGTVTEFEDNRFLIEDIFMLEQTVSTAETEISENGMVDLIADNMEERPDLNEKLLFWGHVHPGNCTNASGQDNDQMEDFDYNDWFVRGIFGRNGRAEFTFYDYKKGVIWGDVPWQIHCPISEERQTFWEDEVKEKVTKKVYVTPNTGKYNPANAGKKAYTVPYKNPNAGIVRQAGIGLASTHKIFTGLEIQDDDDCGDSNHFEVDPSTPGDYVEYDIEAGSPIGLALAEMKQPEQQRFEQIEAVEGDDELKSIFIENCDDDSDEADECLCGELPEGYEYSGYDSEGSV